MRKTLPLLLALGAACATPRIAGTEIEDTPANRAIVNLVERYRAAVETRDVETLKALASQQYYENASTTWTSDDDWGRPDLEEVLGRYQDHVKAISYEVKIKRLQVRGKRANVDLHHTWAFQYTDGERDAWTRKTDDNRLELVLEGGDWRVLSGM